MNSKKLRTIIPAAILIIAGVAFIAHTSVGTLSSFGWRDIAVMCPLGALATMIAAKALIPRAIVSIVLAAIIFLLFGRAFCGWACPVPLVSKLRGEDKKAKPKKAATETAEAETSEGDANLAPLTDEEKAALKGGCASCASKRGGKLDSRHIVLIAALVSTLIFGFPVFCIVCPIGLTFASIFLIVQLFAAGQVSWLVVVAPALLLIEVVFFRKWCHELCPLGALMSLTAKANRTFKPVADPAKCLETAKGISCGACARVCPEGINLHHPELSEAEINECTRCRLCVEACPTGALSLPFLAKPAKKAAEEK